VSDNVGASRKRCRLRIALAMVARKPGHQGERGVSRKTIAQGRPDESAFTCGD
jgi:hypothetical protein